MIFGKTIIPNNIHEMSSNGHELLSVIRGGGIG